MTDISVDIPFVAENVPDPNTLTNPQLIAVGRRVAQRAWAVAQNALTPGDSGERPPWATNSADVVVVHRDPNRGRDKWVNASVPFSGDAQGDANAALALLADAYDVKPANFDAVQRPDWGPFVFQAVRRNKP